MEKSVYWHALQINFFYIYASNKICVDKLYVFIANFLYYQCIIVFIPGVEYIKA